MSQAGLSKNPNSAPGATSYVTNSGTAAPIAGVLDIIGINGISTSASGGTVTITAPNQNMLIVKKTLTSADLKALGGTPFVMVAAQGANTVIVPISITARFVYGTDQFTDGSITLFYGSAAGISLTIPFAFFVLTGAADQYNYSPIEWDRPSQVAVGVIDNIDLVIDAISVPVGNLFNDSSLIVEIAYYVSTLT